MCWSIQFQQTLSRIRLNKGCCRIAILGVGQELRGDDALGLIAVRRMRRELLPLACDLTELLLIEAGTVPENFSSQLQHFQPDLLLVIDAAWLGQAPGTIAWLEAHQTTQVGFSTHSLPLGLILTYLAAEAGCEAAILGIQPADLSFGVPLTEEVRRAITKLICGFNTTLSQEPMLPDPLNYSRNPEAMG